MKKKRVLILGATGSIGTSTLDIIRCFPEKFQAVGLSTNCNIELLKRQINEFRPPFVCVSDIRLAEALKPKLKSSNTKLFSGECGLLEMIGDKRIDSVVLAISGSAALLPLLKAIDNGKDVILANKEALVMAGTLIMNRAKKRKVNIIPVDSEQSAVWQCLDNRDSSGLKNIYLTASGGPLRNVSREIMKDVSLKRVLNHPRWKMGKKISVDSATLMNKGFELLELMHLFGVSSDKVKVVVHPEAIIHSMIEFTDGVIIAQLSATDMRIPIQYALSYPQRLPGKFGSVDFYKLAKFHFEKPDLKKFPCLELAYYAAEKMGTFPCVLNAANEVCVNEFLRGRLGFLSIPKIIKKVLARHRNKTNPELEDILQANEWARKEAFENIYPLRSYESSFPSA